MRPTLRIGALLAATACTLLVTTAVAQTASKVVLHGAGASFPAPLYKQWIAEYERTHPDTGIRYQSVGSSEGAKRFLAEAVDFGASDSALTDEQIAQSKHGALMIPATAGMVVLAYNLPGVNGPLRLSRTTYADLLSGRITRWNDARIQSANPDQKLPNRDITLIARLDGSGTTFALTNHLAAVSKRWVDSGRRAGNLMGWPTGTVLLRGNEGVSGRIRQVEGSIGYVEYNFAKQLGLAMAHLENKAGQFVAPGEASGRAAIAENLARIPGNLRAFIPDPEGEQSYPIVSLSWLLLREREEGGAKTEALRRFVDWSLTEGQMIGARLGYVPLPEALVVRARAAIGGAR